MAPPARPDGFRRWNRTREPISPTESGCTAVRDVQNKRLGFAVSDYCPDTGVQSPAGSRAPKHVSCELGRLRAHNHTPEHTHGYTRVHTCVRAHTTTHGYSNMHTHAHRYVSCYE